MRIAPLILLPFVACGGFLIACGGPAPDAPDAPSGAVRAAEGGAEPGTILSLRPLGTVDARSPAMAQVLRAAAGTGGAPGTTEVVVRLDRAGRDVALVQPAGWRVGQRVTLTPGERPTLIAGS